jgi:type 2 lantibiotic biosynthesis protein LanM
MPYACKTVDRDTYGYMEFIIGTSCPDVEGVELYFENLGAVISLCWVLGVADLHHENLIAAGSEPVPVDLEVMLERPVTNIGSRIFEFLRSAHADLLLKTGILPYPELGPAGIFDVSALGVSLVGRAAIPPQSLPTLNGVSIAAVGHEEAIRRGFKRASSLLIEHGRNLLSDPDFAAAIRNVETRWIARRTGDYEDVFDILSQPAILRDGCNAELAVTALLINTSGNCGHLLRVARSELHQLLNGEIPYFLTRADRYSLFCGNEDEHPHFFAADGMQILNERLSSLHNLEPLHLQAITEAMAPTRVRTASPTDKRSNVIAPVITKSDYLSAAVAIGRHLTENAYRSAGLVTWPGHTLVADKVTRYGIPPPTLYEGVSGIGVFTGYLCSLTQLPELAKLCGWILTTLDAILAEPGVFPGDGLFDGLTGLIFARALIQHLLGQTAARVPPETLKALRERAAYCTNYDLVSGAAGIVVGLQRYYRLSGDRNAIPVIATAISALQRGMISANDFVFWSTQHEDRTTTSGVSHGTAGCGWALAEWAILANDGIAADLARKAFAYEGSILSDRIGVSGLADMTWCHGVPGIAAAAACARNVIGEDAACAFSAATNQQLFSGDELNDDSLCHGTIGLIDHAVEVGTHEKTAQLMGAILRSCEERGFWRSGLPGNAYTASLMCGLSGIGLGLLRAYNPNAVRSILRLDIPLPA